MKTTAAVLVEAGRPLEMADVEIPLLGPGQALVEVAFSGACHTQVLEVRGRRGPDPWLPHCLGHEGAGTVLETGAGVTKVRPGDRVVLSWIAGSGAEAGGSHYRWNGSLVNAGPVTTFSRHAVIGENRMTVMSDGLPMDVAVLLGCALQTGIGAIANTARARAGDAVLVLGCGGIGLAAVIGAERLGCAPIIAVDRIGERLALAERFGATHRLQAAAAEAIDAVMEISAGAVDVAVEATGVPEVMAAALSSVRDRGGRAVVIGNAPHGARLTIDPQSLNDGRSLLGSWGGDAKPDRDIPRITDMILSGDVDPARMLSRPYALAQVNGALDDLEQNRVGRPLIDMSLT